MKNCGCWPNYCIKAQLGADSYCHKENGPEAVALREKQREAERRAQNLRKARQLEQQEEEDKLLRKWNLL